VSVLKLLSWPPRRRGESREFAADDYAARLGQGVGLARFLSSHALENDLPVPFMWLSGESHPFSEHRIDSLYRRDEAS
jgi:hypothetical protein